ncbi:MULTISPECIES: hypothetical protein [unclassified Streptomyces]|uniref:hypothetical protein n=1 Tax=unclassified Streptomyces TaxID=2593676 RepID=UPI00341E54D9
MENFLAAIANGASAGPTQALTLLGGATDPSPGFMTRTLLVLIVLLLAVIAGITSGVLHRMEHAAVPAAIWRGCIAFASVTTLSLGILAIYGLS